MACCPLISTKDVGWILLQFVKRTTFLNSGTLYFFLQTSHKEEYIGPLLKMSFRHTFGAPVSILMVSEALSHV